MDYIELADEFLDKFRFLVKAKMNKPITGAVRGEGFVLYHVALQKGDVLPGEIGHKMGVSTARVAMALNSLEKKGLITRKIDVHDRRKILVGITPEGRVLAEETYRAALRAIAELFILLGKHDAEEYVRITGKLVELVPELSDC